MLAAKEAAVHLYKRCYFHSRDHLLKKTPSCCLLRVEDRDASGREILLLFYCHSHSKQPQVYGCADQFGLLCPDTGCSIIYRTNQSAFSDGDKVVAVTHTGTYLCDFKWNTITQDFPVEALLGHVAGEPAGSLEGIFQPLQFHIGDWKTQPRKNT